MGVNRDEKNQILSHNFVAANQEYKNDFAYLFTTACSKAELHIHKFT